MELKNYLEEYKALTLDIMEHINTDGNINYLVAKREKILNQVKQANFNKEQIESIGKALKLIELDNEMQEMARRETINIKKKMQQLRKREQGNKLYLSNGYSHYTQSRFDKRY